MTDSHGEVAEAQAEAEKGAGGKILPERKLDNEERSPWV
jgi:hypothetical protein